MQSLLLVEHLRKRHGLIQAVDDLSFQVHPGDVYGFLGQNGAGKSTTLRMLVTLIFPDAGSIRIFGRELYQHRAYCLSRMGCIIERPDLYRYLSALDNLRLFAALSGLRPTRNEMMLQLEQVGLANRANDKVGTYSQGMKQRLGIAVALQHNPELVILDEPTNGLDPQGIADMRQLVLRMQQEFKKTVIVSSHLLSEMEAVCNRMLIIHQGKAVVEGNLRDLLAPEKTRVVLTTDNNTLVRNLMIQTQWQDQLCTTGEELALTMHQAEVPDLVRWLTENRIAVFGVRQQHALEDYFIRLTQTPEHVDAPAR